MNNDAVRIRDYLLKEIEYLRTVTDESVKETRSLERYSLLATGAIWSWCAAARGDIGLKIIVWFPFFLTTLFGVRAWGIAKEIHRIDRYLKRSEASLGITDGFGWAQRQAEHRSPFEVMTVYVFWGVLQTATVLFALLYDLGVFVVTTAKPG